MLRDEINELIESFKTKEFDVEGVLNELKNYPEIPINYGQWFVENKEKPHFDGPQMVEGFFVTYYDKISIQYNTLKELIEEEWVKPDFDSVRKKDFYTSDYFDRNLKEPDIKIKVFNYGSIKLEVCHLI